ncbi:MAG: sigma 54-interacting transcriptional regulator [Proteobacteria bacterium]|nr:sigma 54-interacting transcriptional regulator [Pseudomonadota bacterium]
MKIVFDENEFFRQATLRICGSLNFETAIRRCFEYIKNYLPIDGICLGIYEPDLNMIRINTWIGPKNLKKPDNIIKVPETYWKQIKAELASQKGIRIINDLTEEEPFALEMIRRIWSEDGSVIRVDLQIEDEKVGGLSLYATKEVHFTEEHARLIMLLHDPFAIALSNLLRHEEVIRLKDLLSDENQFLHRQLHKITGDTIIGSEFGLKPVMDMVRQIAPLDNPVLLLGETGVGKEVIANAIHYSSPRKNGPFVKVNCGAIPENLIDSELFGHEKGAFTGAVTQRRGLFERADGGTIFLDEIGELPMAVQVRLLRVLQYKEIERLGGDKVISVDTRIFSATHRNLEQMVKDGLFREDLFFRLNVFPIMIPPLRQRKGDIPALAYHFIERKSGDLKIHNRPSLSTGVVSKLQDYHWPGNVRELENMMERALIRSQIREPRDILSPNDFFFQTSIETAQGRPAYTGQFLSLDDVITDHLRFTLEKTKGRIEGSGGAAEILNIHPSTLRGKLRKLNIPHGKKK